MSDDVTTVPSVPIVPTDTISQNGTPKIVTTCHKNVTTVTRRLDMPEPMKLTMEVVRDWVKEIATGEFHYKEVLEGRVSPKAYDTLRKYIRRCCEEGICEPVGQRNGRYRPVAELPQPIDWQSVNAKIDFPIDLPFNLRKYVWIDYEALVVVAGSKSSGKSGFLMHTVALNMYNSNVIFLTNMEGGINQLKRRFDQCGIEIPNPPPFQTFHMTDNFHDAIKYPDTLYVIDYIDVPDTGEYFMIPTALKRIKNKLNRSVAMVGLQKRKNSDIAFGGEQTLKSVTLYLALDAISKERGRLKIVDAKVSPIPNFNPKNMQWSFKYENEGIRFADIQPLKTDEEIDF